MRTPMSLVVWVVVLLFIMPTTAFAYLDPVSGNALVQTLIAMAGATFAAVVTYRRAMKDFFRRLLRRDSSNHPQV